MLYDINSADLAIRTESFDSGFATALTRPLDITAQSQSIVHRAEPPPTVSLKTIRLLPRTFSFSFLDSPSVSSPLPKQPHASISPSPTFPLALPVSPVQPLTRIKPPGDIIKLADRLHYLLQPSLESLLAEGSLAFPFRPFPFQFEGTAFLYPRQAAILADEMGLGKTLQTLAFLQSRLESPGPGGGALR